MQCAVHEHTTFIGSTCHESTGCLVDRGETHSNEEAIVNELPHIVIVGAGYAGRSVIGRLIARRVRATLTCVEPAEYIVERVRAHQRLAGQDIGVHALRDLLFERCAIVRDRVVSVDFESRQLDLASGDALEYDHLILATGSSEVPERVPGLGEHAVLLDGRALDDGISSVDVIGGGASALEVAAELADTRRDLDVRVVCTTFAPGFHPRAVRIIERFLTERGVRILTGSTVARVTEAGALLGDGTQLSAGATVWAAGFEVSPLPRMLGLAVDPSGRALVDGALRVRGHHDVWACGDAAHVPDSEGRALGASCATAMPMGMQVAENIAAVLRGDEARALSLRRVGVTLSLGRRDALVQPLGRREAPWALVLRGRLAVWSKELLVRMALHAPRLEGARRRALYAWPKAHAKRGSRLLPEAHDA